MAAANRLAERAVNVRSEAREAYLRYRGNFDLARHYQSRVLPLRRRSRTRRCCSTAACWST